MNDQDGTTEKQDPFVYGLLVPTVPQKPRTILPTVAEITKTNQTQSAESQKPLQYHKNRFGNVRFYCCMPIKQCFEDGSLHIQTI